MGSAAAARATATPARRLGGTKASERAVGAALNWLYRHQTAQGKWSLDFRHQCKGGTCSGPGVAQSDAAATAMALLPFLAAGQTHKSKGPYQQTIAKGLAWLIKQQRPDGDLSGGCEQPMYAHGLATIALCEAYGMTRDEHVGAAARQGRGLHRAGPKRIDRRLALSARRSRRHLRVRLADHGPEERPARRPAGELHRLRQRAEVAALRGQGRAPGALLLPALSRSHSHHDRRGNALPAVPGH